MQEAERQGVVGITVPIDVLRYLVGEIEQLNVENVRWLETISQLSAIGADEMRKREALQKELEESKRYKSALRKIVCLNIPIPDEVFNIANDALERSETK